MPLTDPPVSGEQIAELLKLSHALHLDERGSILTAQLDYAIPDEIAEYSDLTCAEADTLIEWLRGERPTGMAGQVA